MFQPALWRQTKVSVLTLFSLGLFLAVPGGFVFSPLLIWLGQRNLSLTNRWLSQSSPPSTEFG